MHKLHLFGASTPTGKSLISKINEDSFINPICYSRSNTSFKYIDFENKESYSLFNFDGQSIFISLAPIWLFTNFFSFICKNNKQLYKKLHGLIVCSSTSVLTKQNSKNRYDKKLVSQLLTAEKKICLDAEVNKIPLVIIRPSMIYGDYKSFEDKNISEILKIMENAPLIPMPYKSGLRQPIHTSQLSDSILTLTQRLLKDSQEKLNIEIINLGGDEELTYYQMVKALKDSLPINNSARNCIILKIPSILFYLIFTPLFIINNKFFSAILRIGSNLSGFKKAYKLNNSKPKKFPIN